MKIGILTYQYAINYGAVLQAYALKKFLDDYGYDCKIINYNSSSRFMKKRPFIKRILTYGWTIIRHFFGYKKKVEAFHEFKQNYLDLNMPEIYEKDKLEAYVLNSAFDVLVVGSDQVWNGVINGHDDAYFLNFEKFNGIKTSYAASFGVSSIDEKYMKEIKPLLERFVAISVRETTGEKILNEIEIKAKTVVDPVFLIKEKWTDVFDLSSLYPQEKYILCYVMPGNARVEQKIVQVANILSKYHKMKIKYIGRKEYNYLLPNGHDERCDSPISFLKLIKNAELVVTNSFHGTAFSIIFNKEIFSIVDNKLEGSSQLSSRIIDLLDQVGLHDRIVDVEDNSILKNKINYSHVNNYCQMHIQESKKWLLEALSYEGDVR